MIMKKYLFIVVLLLSVISGLADVIVDPVKHYLDENETISGDQLLKLEVDINGDGRNEMLISLSKSNAYKSGHLWTLYIGVEGGYVEAKGTGPNGEATEDGIVEFRPDAYFVGNYPEKNARGLLAYVPSELGKGFLTFLTINGTQFRQVKLGEISPKTTDKAKYERYFDADPIAKIQKIAIPK